MLVAQASTVPRSDGLPEAGSTGSHHTSAAAVFNSATAPKSPKKGLGRQRGRNGPGTSMGGNQKEAVGSRAWKGGGSSLARTCQIGTVHVLPVSQRHIKTTQRWICPAGLWTANRDWDILEGGATEKCANQDGQGNAQMKPARPGAAHRVQRQARAQQQPPGWHRVQWPRRRDWAWTLAGRTGMAF
jgi:hypothetical protein